MLVEIRKNLTTTKTKNRWGIEHMHFWRSAVCDFSKCSGTHGTVPGREGHYTTFPCEKVATMYFKRNVGTEKLRVIPQVQYVSCLIQ